MERLGWWPWLGTVVLASVAAGCSCAENETIVCCELGGARELRAATACTSSGGRIDDAASCEADASLVDAAATLDASGATDAGDLDAEDGDAGDLDAGDRDASDLDAPAVVDLDAGPSETCILAEAAGDALASSLAFSADGRRVILGAEANDGVALTAGHARVFERGADGWTQLGADLDGEAMDDRFGVDVAMSADGSRVAVGAYYHDGARGRVRVFDLVAGAWTQVGANLDGAGNNYGHGWSLALSGDGSRLVVGGPGVSSTNGHVVVYEWRSGVWETTGTFAGAGEDGSDVDISDDGRRIAVGAPSRLGGGALGGVVRVYEWSGSDWSPMGEIAGVATNDNAGAAISLSSDGSMIAVGAPYNASGGLLAGHVRVFRWTTDAWTQVGADVLGMTREYFGSSVGLSGDGTRLVVGGPNTGGAVRFYTLVGDAWEEASAASFHTTGRNGTDVALSTDGHTVAASAPYEHLGSGEVCLYVVP